MGERRSASRIDRVIGTAEIEPVGDPPCRYAGEDPRKGILRPGRQQLVGFLENLVAADAQTVHCVE